jgi:glutathione S-transferase
MTKPKLTYFDAHISRGEECRIALAIAGVDYEDVRISRDEWMKRKASSPFGTMPMWDEPGKPTLAQTNAILGLIGRRHGLLPSDPFEAARHEAFMCHVEDLRAAFAPFLRIADEAEKKKARTEFASGALATWAGFTERQLTGEGPFVGGAAISVADVKLYMLVRWFARGTVDHVPADVFAPYPKIMRLYGAVAAHPKAKGWIDAH